MFALALWALVWRVGSGWFCPKLDPGGHVFLLNVLLHRWIIHGEQVAHNTACSGSSALYLLTTTWTLVFHILWQHPPRYQIHLWLLYFALVRDTEVLTYPGVRAGTWTIQHQFRFPPTAHLVQRVQNVTNSPESILLITLSQSVYLSAVSDFKRKCFIQRQRKEILLTFYFFLNSGTQ